MKGLTSDSAHVIARNGTEVSAKHSRVRIGTFVLVKQVN
jgi:hypothetical protein